MTLLGRYRADGNHVNGDLAVKYYGQRASFPGTLVFTEATFVAVGAGSKCHHIPGVWSDAQIAVWKRVTDATWHA
ncbi:hypothetical protein FRC06_010588 [Ceratobasidium sp. 370]|nr:hypothetical protein FRC06_010588 [Ceratobasidium sp. 370]